MLGPLGEELRRVFGVNVEQRYPRFDPELAYDSSRGQYNSRLLLAALLAEAPSGTGRILGVTSVDLFIPVLTWVFGEAQLDGAAAIVSFHRLDNEIYGLPASEDLLFERLRKEAIHELGHTYNLVHCHDDRCVMSSSTYVDGVDIKSARFCAECTRILRGTGANRPGSAEPGSRPRG
jgi:archaemetzincin